MKHRFLHTLVVNVLVSLALQASPARFPQAQEPQHSRIVVVDGEKKILLPNGRIIPFGQSAICEGQSCNLKDDITITATPAQPSWLTRNWTWLVPVTTVAVICAVLCRGNNDSSVRITPPGMPITPPGVPPATVPEVNNLLLLGTGLLALSWRLGKRRLT